MYYSRPEAAQGNASHIIRVTGEGSLSAVPDQAKVSLGVMTENKDVNAAQKQNNEIMANVMHGLMANGISQRDIQTSLYRIEPQYIYENGQQNLKGYQVNHQLQVTVNDIAKTGSVITTAVGQGANSVTSIQFTLRSVDTYYGRALSLAVNDAQQKAMAIARDVGGTLNRFPVKVTEIAKAIHPGPIPFQGAMMSQGEAVPIQIGENQITARIEAEFFYTP